MDDYIHNPVGNEHPLRGCMIGAALAAAIVSAIVGCCVSCTAVPDTDAHNQQIATAVDNAVRIVAEVAVQVREARREEAGETSGGNNADPVQTANPAESGGAPTIKKD